MDCKTARLLLDFARPQRCELEAEEAGALESHLDHCSDCHILARSERHFDESLGQAMRQVEVPAGLRENLLARLEVQRGDWQRQSFARYVRLTVAAAAVLLFSWFGWQWLRDQLAGPIDLEKVPAAFNNAAAEDRRQWAEDMLKRMGVDAPLPPQVVNYNYLACPPALTELPGHPGRLVPMLYFEQGGRRAWIYLVKDKALRGDVAGSGTFKAELLPFEDAGYRFLALHDGDSLEWLLPPQPPAT